MAEFKEEDLQKFKYTMVEEGVDIDDACRIITRLRPKPKFAKGQVLARKPPNGDTLYFRHGPTNAYYDSYSHRALTPTEMGPLVQELFKYAEHSASRAGNTSAQDLIKRFNKVHGDA